MTPDERPGPPAVRVARAAEWLVIGELFGDAFFDDPLWAWMAADPTRRRRHLGTLFAHVVRPLVASGFAHVNEDRSGAAVWAAPNGWKTTTKESIPLAVPFMRLAGLGNLRSRLAALEQMERLHPAEPHWYLEIIGADPSRRGQGIGSSLLQPGIERCDVEGLPAYLESSKEENIPLYGRFGFEVLDEVTLAPGAPPVWPMWREPR